MLALRPDTTRADARTSPCAAGRRRCRRLRCFPPGLGHCSKQALAAVGVNQPELCGDAAGRQRCVQSFVADLMQVGSKGKSSYSVSNTLSAMVWLPLTSICRTSNL
jgi:hypothetical protein